MYIKIHKPVKNHNNNCGSCIPLAIYLEKENLKKDLEEKQYFFNNNGDSFTMHDVVKSIDNNKAQLANNETKYYMLTINPSQKELKNICKSISNRDISDISQLTKNEKIEFEKALKTYTNNVMDEYAKNFNRDLNGNDILYYSKIEHERTFKRNDEHILEQRKQHIKLDNSNIDRVKYASLYYADEKANKIAHGLKKNDPKYIKIAANDMVSKIPDNAILIPMPSSPGYATYTKELSEKIKEINPTLDVFDVLKCNSREKLFELKKQGFEANSDYFNFNLSGPVPNDRPIYLIDNTMATGTTFVNALSVLPDANICVHSINENLEIKKAKIEQKENLDKLNLVKTGDIKQGLQSHIHVIVSRKDVSNTIKLSPMANAKDSVNFLPDGTPVQIGFDREKFVQSCELNFDKTFDFKREIQDSFNNYKIISNDLKSLTKNLSANFLPEEMQHYNKVTKAYNSFVTFENALNHYRKHDFNLSLAQKLINNNKHLNSLTTACDSFNVQSKVISGELKSNSFSLDNIKDSHIEFFSQHCNIIKDNVTLLIEAGKKYDKPIIAAHKEEKYATVKDLREKKVEACLQHYNDIKGSLSMLNDFAKDYNLPEFNLHDVYINNNAFKYASLSNNLNSISKSVSDIHSKFNFLGNVKDLKPDELYQIINNIRGTNKDVYENIKNLKTLSNDINEIKHSLFTELKNINNAVYYDKFAFSLLKKDEKPEFDLKKILEKYEPVKKQIYFQISVLSRVNKEILDQKEKLQDFANYYLNSERAVNPAFNYKTLISQIPGTDKIMSAINTVSNVQKALAASNPLSAAAEVAKVVGKKILQAGMGI